MKWWVVLIVAGFVVAVFAAAPDPATMQRDPSAWQTYRAYYLYGQAACKAGNYAEAMPSLMHVYKECPRRGANCLNVWSLSAKYLALCYEELGDDVSAARLYAQSAKFSDGVNRARSAKAWRRMREQSEGDN